MVRAQYGTNIKPCHKRFINKIRLSSSWSESFLSVPNLPTYCCIAFLQSSSDSSGLFLSLIWMPPQPSSLSSYSTVKRRLRRSRTRRSVDRMKSNVNFWVRFQVPNAAIFSLNKEDHTVGNLIRHQLMKDPNVLFAGYKNPSPFVNQIIIRVQTTSDYTPQVSYLIIDVYWSRNLFRMLLWMLSQIYSLNCHSLRKDSKNNSRKKGKV